MTDDNSTRRSDGTFKEGHSGNRRGPPLKSQRKRPKTAFDILFHPVFDPIAKDLPPELGPQYEAAYRTYVAALKKDSKRARRVVLKHMRRRAQEQVHLAALSEPRAPVVRVVEPDPRNVDDALLILGLATEDTEYARRDHERTRLKLMRWAVQMALGRRHGGHRLTDFDVSNINRVTVDSNKLSWSRRYGNLNTRRHV